MSANGDFTFAILLADLSPYAVMVLNHPDGQTCSVTNGSGTIAAADVGDVIVDCIDDMVPPVLPATPIPTLSEWALLILLTLMGLVVVTQRRHNFKKNQSICADQRVTSVTLFLL